MKTLILAAQEIKKIIKMSEIIKAVEDAFFLQGKKETIMPAKIYLPLKKYSGDFRAMPAYLEGSAGIKWVNAHPLNPLKFHLPSVMATIIYNDPRTGFPLAIMDGTIVTNYRTGAAGAIASKYLARKNSKTLGLIGCGKQAETQLLAHLEIFTFEEILITDINKEQIKKFKSTLCSRHLPVRRSLGVGGSVGYLAIKEASLEEVAGSDIICTTTPSRKPILRKEWLKPGTQLNAIGADAPGKEELDPQILKKAKIVVDDFEQASKSGEVNVPLARGIIKEKDIYSTLGEIVTQLKPGRINETEITVFDSTGLAVQDIAVARLLYRKAKKYKLGKEVNLIEY